MSVEFISLINARLADRTDVPRIWVTFRPVVAATDDLAWEKAHRTLAAIEQTHHGRFVLPVVRQELAHREASGQRGAVAPQPPITPASLISARG